MRLFIAGVAVVLLVSSCAWDNSPPPLHRRIRMERSGSATTVAGAAGSTNLEYHANFDTNQIQGASGGGGGLPTAPLNSSGAASVRPGATINSTPATGAANAGLGGTGTGSATATSPNPSQPSSSSTPSTGTSSSPGTTTPAPNSSVPNSSVPNSSSGTRTVP